MPKKTNKALSVSFRPYTSTDNAYLVKLVREHMKPVLEASTGVPYNPEEFLYHVQTSQTRILESNGAPIGFFTYLPLPFEGRLLFSSMVLEKEYQGRGIGKRIFEFIEGEALRLNCPEVECEVQKGNEGALRLYKELNYQQVEVPWENTIRLRKRITPATATTIATQIPNEPKTALSKKPSTPIQTAKLQTNKSKKAKRKSAVQAKGKKAAQTGLRTFQR